MRFQILHESRGRVRLRAVQASMSMEQADILEAWLLALPQVDHVTVHERICGVIIVFHGSREALYQKLAGFSYALAAPKVQIASSRSRAMNRAYKEKLVFLVLRHYLKKLYLPLPLRRALSTFHALPRIFRAAKTLLHGKLTVDVLDGAALKLSMPLSVLSAMREAGRHKITVKGGKYLEKLSEADSLIFDKTGTLTHACPTVQCVVPFNGRDEAEMLRTAACLEEHFPHSVANAVVRAAEERGLDHHEMHSEPEYVVAHGIATKIDGERAIIGSRHFVFEDEGVTIRPEDQARFDALDPGCSWLYLAIGGVLSAVIGILDPLRPEACEIVTLLHEAGIGKLVMLTGDSRNTAAALARELGLDDFHAEVLPEDKARYIRAEQAQGRTVVMIGDGINDAPALSLADVGIAIGSGATIAREVADITIAAGDLRELVLLRRLSEKLMGRIGRNYRFVMGFNGALIALGALGLLPPAASALLHNGSTLLLSMDCLTDLLPE